jgi:hypothetical protein
MKWTLWFGRLVARRLPPQELVDLAMEVWPHAWHQIPQEHRLDFLRGVAQKNLGVFLAGLDRAERADLMNSLLPLAARELPLADLDFLAAFSSPGGGYHPEAPER